MKKEFSKHWVASRQPRKQRKYKYNAPAHLRGGMISSHLGKSLRAEYKKRSVPLRKGDEVIVMRGEHRKKSGKVSRVDRKKYKVYVEGIKTKKVSGQEVEIPFDSSNLIISKLILEDKERARSLRRGKTSTKTES